jgi:dTDP-4-dehydrorhamnose 3,5-epimerase
MKIDKTSLFDAYLITPDVYEDNRGYFFETYSKLKLDTVFNGTFVQGNQSLSKQIGVIRGLHCQSGEYCQSKLVRVIQGAVDDVIVDVREGSPTYLKWEKFRLSGDNKRLLFIPKGFLHGFVTLSENVVFCYQVDAYFNKTSERGVLFSDPLFGIDWGFTNPILSEKDKQNPLFFDSGISFQYKGK